MSEHRDRAVGDALARLDVPDHDPDFWAVLDARLAAGDCPEADLPPTTYPEETTVVRLDRTRDARRRTPAYVLVAAAAIIVALFAGVALFGADGDDVSQIDVAETTVTSVPGDPEDTATTGPVEGPATSITVPPETTTTHRPEARDVAFALATATQWIHSLAAGDLEAAYGSLDDGSRAAMNRAELDGLASGLFEGAAAFAAEGIEHDVTILDGRGDLLAVVTFAGDVQREGMVETAAYPVVVTATGVHFTLDGPRLELEPGYAQRSGATLASPLELVVQEETDAWIWIDDEDAEPLAGRGTVRVDVEAEAGAGTHLVSVVAVQDGRITARAYTVVVP